jgi:hypothetical protein
MANRTETGRNATGTAGQKSAQSSQQKRPSTNGNEAASDELYGVVSVLYHALQGIDTYGQYCDDARQAGDEELVEFFETCRTEESNRAARAKLLLAERLEDSSESDEDDDEDDDEEED